jgi:two-component system sensor histidine kinase YesM
MKTLRLRIITVLLGMALFIGMSAAISYYAQSIQNIKANSETLAANTVTQVSRNVAQYFLDIRNIIKPLYIDDTVQKLLINGSGDIPSTVKARRYVSELKDTSFLLYDLVILDGDWNKLVGVYGMLDQRGTYKSLRAQYEASEDKGGWLGPFEIPGEDANQTRWCYVQVNVLRNLLHYDEQLGYLCVFLDVNALEDSFRYMAGDGGSLGIVGKDGAVFASSKDEELGKSAEELMQTYGAQYLPERAAIWSGDKLITLMPSGGGFGFYSIDDLNNFNQEKRILINNIAMVLLLSLTIAAFAGAFLVLRILRPLEVLRRNMVKAGQGDFGNPILVVKRDEIGQLTATYNFMIGRIRGLMDDVRVLEREKMESELYALQAQINPHFVFNTLVTIRLLAERFGESQMAELIANFSRVLRSSIALGRKFLTLREELECVRSFCQIQRLRYDHEFSLTVEAEEELMDLEVLKFVLQIPVENAIAHALKDKDGDGHIWLDCSREGAMIAFTIEDDGPGFPEETLRALRERLETCDFKGFQNGVGLLNLQKRIRLHYGEGHGILLENTARGARVTISIPDHPGGVGHEADDR